MRFNKNYFAKQKSFFNARIEEIDSKEMYKPSLIEKIVKENAVFLSDSYETQLVKTMNPGLKLYTGRNKDYFGLAGYLFNQKLSINIKNDVNRM